MTTLHPAFADAQWPRPADVAAAERERAAWVEAGAGIEDARCARSVDRLATAKAARPLLDAVFGNSPFLSHAAQAEPAFMVDRKSTRLNSSHRT